MARLRLADLIGAGIRAVSKYTGTVLAVFVVQSLIALGAMIAIAFLLYLQFGHLPMFDEAVDGDLLAIGWCLRHGGATFAAIGGVILGSMLLWQLASWFIAGGIYAVLARQPDGRGETARCFGAGGATTYLAYARVWLCSLPGLLITMILLGLAVVVVYPRMATALTLTELFVPLFLASLPGLLALHFTWTVAEYARVELTLRHDSHDPGVVKTYLRSIAYVARRPITLVHSGLGWLLFALVTLAYIYLAQGHAMYGSGGAIALFFVRQGVALLRFAIRFGILAGQIELGRTRPAPPMRRPDAKDVVA